MNTMFTVEESNLICIFVGEGRNEVIEDIERVLLYLDDSDMGESSHRVIAVSKVYRKLLLKKFTFSSYFFY